MKEKKHKKAKNKSQFYKVKRPLKMNIPQQQQQARKNDLNVDELIDRILEFDQSPAPANFAILMKHLRETFPEYKQMYPNFAHFKTVLDDAIVMAKARTNFKKQSTSNKMDFDDDDEDDEDEDDDDGETKDISDMSDDEEDEKEPTSDKKQNGTTPTDAKPAPTVVAQPQPATISFTPKPPKQIAVNPEQDPNKAAKKELVKKQVLDRLDKNKKKAFVVMNRPTTRYCDLGGIEPVLQDIHELIEYPFTHPEIYSHLGVEPPRGILLYGPPGSGKTMLASAIAGELGVPFFSISAPEIVSGMSGESEAKLRALFKDAVENAPSIIFIDEIDAITPKRETASREMEKRIVAQLLTCMDDLSFEKTGGKMVLLIGATNRPDSLDAALRRAGRFDREISLGIPDEKARGRILQVLSKKLKVSGDLNFSEIAKLTPGFVGADLQALTKEAAVVAIHRIFHNLFTNVNNATTTTTTTTTTADHYTLEKRSQVSVALKQLSAHLTAEQLSALSITMSDFGHAVKKVQPSAKREGFATVPNVSWEDIGALEEIREELTTSIMEPIQFPEKYEQLGLTAPAGVLLYGPPGCGKTLLAKAIANSSGANFISIKGPELLNKFVGESERSVRQVFARASASAPCVIFFDELDALCPKRGYDVGNASTERVVNQLLTEMDGLEARRNVFVIAATNRPDIIDPAMLRPGRLDKLLYVSLPSTKGRSGILKTIARKIPLAKDVNLEKIAMDDRCENFSGADLAALAREAAIACLKEHNAKYLDVLPAQQPPMIVQAMHFEMAFVKVFPSVGDADRKMYDRIANKLKTVRSHLNKNQDTKESENAKNKMETD